MSATLTIDLPDDVKATLGKAAREDGVSEGTFAMRALEDYMRLRRFRKPQTAAERRRSIAALKRTMDEMAETARRNGMTQEILDEILKKD
ncbi:MAG: hypothetical protein IPM59_06085 [Chloracidobacterium sp.]|nr:hypothetical protein [Chloracidobacterium sp.]